MKPTHEITLSYYDRRRKFGFCNYVPANVSWYLNEHFRRWIQMIIDEKRQEAEAHAKR